MSVPINSIDIPDSLRALASRWYDGSGSMLYTIAPTGGLTTGGVRPYEYDAPTHSHGCFGNCQTPDVEIRYVNTGDAYATTLLKVNGRYCVGSWGDVVEAYDGRRD